MGQWYFDGTKSSLGGNAQMTFVPAVRLSNKFSLLPTFQTNYRGTRHAQELAGGNTLFQDTWENAIDLKGVWNIGSSWKGRLRTNYRNKWFRETSNEVWNKGLYDYKILGLGGEIEKFWGKKHAAAVGYDYSFLKFPNYNSLESTQSPDLAREFSGDDVLDANIQLYTFRGRTALPWRINTGVQAYYSPREFPDQAVVDLTGLLTTTDREDTQFGTSINFERFFPTPNKTFIITNLVYGYTTLDSNQNHYDARLTTFVSDYFDYGEQKLGGSISYGFIKTIYGHMVFDISSFYTKRDYDKRVIQDGEGNYMTEKLYTEESTLNLAYSCPLSKNFKIRASAYFGRSKSNNDYEVLYRYNFNSANYQFGFTYDY